jgi:2-dehydropantoate 2-reductase
VHHNGWELIRLGERRGPATPRIERVAESWRAAGFRVQTFDDAGPLVWEKLVCNAAFSGTCALVETTVGQVLENPDAWAVAASCAREAFEVARVLGIKLAFVDPVAYVREFGLKIPGAKPSMLLDLLAGRPCEIDVINGAVAASARSAGVEAPVNEAVTALVRAKEAVRLSAIDNPGGTSESG